MKAIELFAGVGGFRLGLEANGHEVVWANEWDKYACDTYDKNFGGQIDRRDITTIPAGDIPAHDLICGGFPCQAFSVAGKRRGFEESRGTLFFEIMRIARHHRTPYLFLENVKGLLSHDGGRTFEVIIRTLDELGYDCQWQVLNSKDFGVPQNRERVFIIGHLRGEPRPEVFPIEGTNGNDIDQLNGQVHQDYRVYGDAGIAPALTSNRGGGSATHPMVMRPGVRIRNTNMAGQSWEHEHAGTIRAGASTNYQTVVTPKVSRTVRAGGQSSLHGSKQNWDSYEIEDRIRRLTPMECERLQGFPDGWTEGVSDTQRYKQMGNAVTVNVIQAIAKMI